METVASKFRVSMETVSRSAGLARSPPNKKARSLL